MAFSNDIILYVVQASTTRGTHTGRGCTAVSHKSASCFGKNCGRILQSITLPNRTTICCHLLQPPTQAPWLLVLLLENASRHLLPRQNQKVGANTNGLGRATEYLVGTVLAKVGRKWRVEWDACFDAGNSVMGARNLVA